MSVQYGFEASPKWHADNPGVMDAIGNFLLEQNSAPIMSWVQGQRQNARNSQLMVYNSQFRLPGIRAQYMKRFGYETLRLIAQPENFGGTIPTFQTIIGGLNFKYDFINFPYAGSTRGLQPLWDNMYQNDFASTPGWWDTDQPLAAKGKPLADHTSGFWSGDPPDPNDGSIGWGTEAYCEIQAGSSIVNKKLKDKQYWEVEITKLGPFDVPGPAHADGTNDEHAITRLVDTFGYRDSNGLTDRTYPPDLNTWRTPTIGVLPGDAVPTKGNFTPALIGGDEYLVDHPRSIGALPISYTPYKSQFDEWREPRYHFYSRFVFFGQFGPIDGYAEDSRYIVSTGHGDDMVFWTGGAIVTDGDCLWSVATAGTGRRRGPDNGQGASVDDVSIFGDAGGTAQFLLVGHVGRGIIDNGVNEGLPLPEFDTRYLPGSYVVFEPDHWENIPALNQDRLTGDCFGWVNNVGDGSTGWVDNFLVTIPPDAPPGKYMPVIKGRPDNFTSLEDEVPGSGFVTHGDYTPYGPDEEEVGAVTMSDELNGFWTGVDLGEPKKGDVYMIATDTTPGAAYIWFGKNGRWYSRSGQLEKNVTLDASNATAKLDPSPDDDSQTADYYPAVSYRMGPLRGAFLGTGAVKFGPPKDFKTLDLVPPLTIQGPDKPKTP